jgi:hypothetical protein
MEPRLTTSTYVPHIDVFLQALRVSRERLDGRAKIAIDPRLLVHILRRIAAAQPFDEAFYLANNDDVAQAHNDGSLGDVHTHFIGSGFLEGRLGAAPEVDAEFYLASNPDVGRAIAAGQVGSAEEHYVQRGAAEGRAATPAQADTVRLWMAMLRPDG